MKKNVLKSITFLIILAFVMCIFLNIFSFKYSIGTYNFDSYYSEKENSIDVLLLGSSHTFNGLDPSILWSKEGIASFCLASSGQPIWDSYYYLKEALKYQKPKVVILDVYTTAYLNSEYNAEETTIKGNFGMRLSKNKIDSLITGNDKSLFIDYLLQYPLFHKRYDEITENDFEKFSDKYTYQYFKGFGNEFNVAKLEKPDNISNITETGDLYPKNEEYLMKIINYCKEMNVNLILTAIPYQVTADEQKKINRIAQIAQENSVNFIDFNHMYDEVGIDFSTDFKNKGHLNYSGSNKVSAWFADYLKQTYALPDRRGQSEYSSWDENLERMNRRKYNNQIANIKDIKEYLSSLNSNGYFYVLNYDKNDLNSILDTDTENSLLKLGMNKDTLSTSGTTVLDNGKIVYNINENNFLWHSAVGNSDITIKESNNGSDNNTYSIYINANSTKSSNKGMLNIWVYDKLMNVKVDSVSFTKKNGEWVATR
jgi:hypothetical protein